MAISMLKIRRPLGRLIFNMGIAIPGKTVFLIETAPRLMTQLKLPADFTYSNDTPYLALMGRLCSVFHEFMEHKCCMMTSSNGNIFGVNGPLCGEFTGPGEFPTQRPVTRSFDVFFDLRLNKRLSKQGWGWWFETPPWSLWRHCNVVSCEECAVFFSVCPCQSRAPCHGSPQHYVSFYRYGFPRQFMMPSSPVPGCQHRKTD